MRDRLRANTAVTGNRSARLQLVLRLEDGRDLKATCGLPETQNRHDLLYILQAASCALATEIHRELKQARQDIPPCC